MRIDHCKRVWVGACAAALVLAMLCGPAHAYVEAPFPLGKVVAQSPYIVLVRVERVDREKNLIIYRKVRDIKGTHKGEINHNIGKRGFHAREWQTVMAWARPGKTALFFHTGGAGEMCIDKYWYQVTGSGWWSMTHAEPYLLRSFAGRPAKLASIVAAMVAGQEVVAPCMVDGDKMALQLRKAKIQRLRVSLKIQDYNPKRDFVGWGAEEFRAVNGMPGFTHYAALSHLGPGAVGISSADINADGKPDLCLFGDTSLFLLQNTGAALNDVPLPIKGGSRAAVWADYDGDKKIDLLLASPFGPRLFQNDGKAFKDVSDLLPARGYHNVTAAAWIDYDGDKRPDIMLADGFRGLRLYRNTPVKSKPPVFEDVSDKVGLGAAGVGGTLKGDHLAVADVNGDGRPDVLYSAGKGLLVLNTPKGFVLANASGISYRTGKVAPVFGDYNADGRADLFVPQRGTSKLFRNEGGGRFADVTAAAGDLGKAVGWARCAVWADFAGKGRLDLFVGCLKGPNRYFRNNGKGTFTDAGDEIGLTYRVFNTVGLAVVDINSDDTPDVVFGNAGQESAILLGNPIRSVGGAVGSVVEPPPVSAVALAAVTGPAGEGQWLHSWGARAASLGLVLVCLGFIIVRGVARAGAGGRETDRRSGRSPGVKSIACLAVAGILACSSTAVRADWPTHRGNIQRTGTVDGKPGPKKPKVLWVYKSAEHFVASPVPGAKAIYVAGLGAFNTGVFHAIATGRDAPERVLWSKAAPYIKRPTVCAPAVVDGLVIFGDGMHQTDDALLYCVKGDSGLPVWQYPVPGKLVHMEGSPAVSKGRVYIGGGAAGVLCVDLKRAILEGSERNVADVVAIMTKRWAEMTAAYERDRKANPQLAIPPSADALPKSVGKLLWQKGKDTWHVDAPLAVTGDFVLAASARLRDERVGTDALLCLKASDGSLVWEVPLKINPWAGPTVIGKTVLVGCSSIRFDRRRIPDARGEVVAVDLASGRVLWRERIRGGVLSPIAAAGTLAVYTCTDGTVVARKIDTGKIAWSYNAKNPFFAGPAIAGGVVYVTDLKAVAHALDLATGKELWTFDVSADLAVQSRTMVFGSPLISGGDLYLATCNLDGETDQPSVLVCLSDKATGLVVKAKPIVVNTRARTVTIPCRIAPRKLPALKEVYPLEVIASAPAPRGQKAHETVLTFEAKPSEIHKALVSLALAPGKPAKGQGVAATGPEVDVFLAFEGVTGRMRMIPIARTLIDSRTGKPMPPMTWHFTGSVMRKPDPNKDAKVYAADLSGTLISIFPVTDETVLQSNMTLAEESLLKLDTNRNVLPAEGAEVKLIIKAR